MPGKILGIDINEDFIAAVQVISGMKGSQVLSCLSVMVDKDNGPAIALKELSEKMDLKSDTYIASINGGNISYQNLTMPFKDPKKIKQTLPFEMESLIPFPINELIIDFNIVNSTERTDILAVAAKKAMISDRLETLESLGITPNLMDIRPIPITLWLLSRPETPDNGLVIDIGLKKISIVLFIDKKISLIRSTPLGNEINYIPLSDNIDSPSKENFETISKSIGLNIKNTLRSFYMQMERDINPGKAFITGIGSMYPGITDILTDQTGIPIEKIDISKDKKIRMDYNMASEWNPALMDGALSLVVRESKKGYGFNLLKGEFESKKSFLKTLKEMRKAGITVLIIIIFLLINQGADYYLVKKRYEEADRQCVELFMQSFPDVKNVKYPALQLKQRIDELKKSAVALPGDINREQKILDLMNDISRRIPNTFDIDVTKMIIDTETVLIYGDSDSYNTVNNLESGLKSSIYFSDVAINKAELDKTGKRVEFTLKLQRK